MSPYKELLKENITKSKTENFKDQIKDLLVFQTKISLYKRIIRSKRSLILIPIFILIGIGIITAGLIVWNNNRGKDNADDILEYTCVFGIFVMAMGFFYKYYRQSVINSIFKKITQESDWNKIYSKWLDLLNIKYESIETIEPKDIKQFYDVLKDDNPVPKKAKALNKEAFFSFKFNNITTYVFSIKWYWNEYFRIQNLWKGNDEYFERLYVIQTRDDQIYKNFNLNLKLGFDNILNNSHKTLENNNFNKKFNYKSNDEIILRKLLTPYTQEFLTNKVSDQSVSFTFKNNHYITSQDLIAKANSSKIKDIFSIIDALNINKKEDKVISKEEISKWILENLERISVILGYSYIIQNFFK